MPKIKNATTAAVVEFAKADPKLVAKVKHIIAEAAAHRYSQSGVYAAHNAVFGKNDAPQACSTCLRNRVAALRAWYKEEPVGEDAQPAGHTVTTGDRLYSLDDLRVLAQEWQAANPLPEDATAEQRLESARGFFALYGPRMDEASAAEAAAGIADMERMLAATAGQADITLTATYEVRQDDESTRNIDFTVTSEDGTKGTVLWEDGSKVKPGTYYTTDGATIAVQPGGKATLKVEDLT